MDAAGIARRDRPRARPFFDRLRPLCRMGLPDTGGVARAEGDTRPKAGNACLHLLAPRLVCPSAERSRGGGLPSARAGGGPCRCRCGRRSRRSRCPGGLRGRSAVRG